MDEEREDFQPLLEFINASPFYRYMNMKVIKAGDGKSLLEMDTKPEMRNLYGILHGGAITTILDSACGIALGTLLAEGEITVTVDLRINFISNVTGGKLIGVGKVIHRGKQTGVTEAQVKNEKGEIIAVGMSTHLICSIEELRTAES